MRLSRDPPREIKNKEISKTQNPHNPKVDEFCKECGSNKYFRRR